MKYVKCTLAIALLLLAACSTLQPDFESPTVTVTDFRMIPSETINPKFSIVLHIINPNRSALELQGLSYSAVIEGYKILMGVANQLPVIPAYGEGDVSLTASADLLGGFRLLSDLMQQQRQKLNYQLDVKLDVGAFVPAIYVQQRGDISLSGGVR